MDESSSRKFRVKNGYCHVFKDSICFTDNGIIDSELSEEIISHNALDIRIIFGFLSTFLGIFVIYNLYQKGYSLRFISFLSLAYLILLFLFTNSSRYKSAKKINREKIIKIKIRKTLGRSSYSTVVITLRKENGKKSHAAFYLLDPLISGKEEYENSLRILKEEKLIEINI